MYILNNTWNTHQLRFLHLFHIILRLSQQLFQIFLLMLHQFVLILLLNDGSYLPEQLIKIRCTNRIYELFEWWSHWNRPAILILKPINVFVLEYLVYFGLDQVFVAEGLMSDCGDCTSDCIDLGGEFLCE
eukprot:654488_1